MIFPAHKLTHISWRYSQSFLVIKAVICGKAFLAIHVISRTLCYQIERSWIVALLQLLKVGNCAAKLLPRASKAAQRFCIPLQLELSCCLASKMLLNSCNLAVQLFCSDFVALYSAASFVRDILTLSHPILYWEFKATGDPLKKNVCPILPWNPGASKRVFTLQMLGLWSKLFFFCILNYQAGCFKALSLKTFLLF